MDHLLQLFLQIIKHAGVQFIYVFGTLFIAGILLTWISRWTQNVFRQFKFPKFGLYVFGIIGIPIHELCHALFAKVFFHNIEKIKWFDPKAKGDSYGAVTHVYNEKNFYHRLGLFFIGMGPVLLTPVFVFFSYRYLVPGAGHFDFSILKPLRSLELFGASLFHGANWSSLGFYGFLYLTVCITSQMELSPDDFKIARGGIFPFFVLFFVANIAAAVFSFDLHGHFLRFIDKTFVAWIGIFALAVTVALINFILCLILMSGLNKLMGAEFIKPFQS